MPDVPILAVTGIPRSGTTLTASLLDRLDRVLCLNEPPRYYEWVSTSRDRAQFLEWCYRDIRKVRVILRAGGTVYDRREDDGSIPTNYFDDNGRRRFRFHPVTRPGCGRNLIVAVKFNEVFTSVLPDLCAMEGVGVIAVVRHPIPTMLSWQTRQIPLSSGTLSQGYRFWPEASAVREQESNVWEFQAKMYEMYCSRYLECAARLQVLKYEDLILEPALLERITGRRYLGSITLSTENKKHSDRCSSGTVSELQRVMFKCFKNAYRFYPDLDAW